MSPSFPSTSSLQLQATCEAKHEMVYTQANLSVLTQFSHFLFAGNKHQYGFASLHIFRQCITWQPRHICRPRCSNLVWVFVTHRSEFIKAVVTAWVSYWGEGEKGQVFRAVKA